MWKECDIMNSKQNKHSKFEFYKKELTSKKAILQKFYFGHCRICSEIWGDVMYIVEYIYGFIVK